MDTRTIVFSLILLLQACGPLLAQTPTPAEPDSPGVLQGLVERAREAKAKVQDAGDFVLSLFASVYQSKIQPVAESYSEWASNVKETLTEKIQTTVSSYM